MIVEEVGVTGTYTPQATDDRTSELTRPQSPDEMEMEMMLKIPNAGHYRSRVTEREEVAGASFQIWSRRNTSTRAELSAA